MMENLLLVFTLGLGLLACGALCLSIFSYRKINGNMRLVVSLLHRSSQDIGTVGKSVDAVLSQNQEALDQQKKTSDHQRVLLASLNRQLVTLESMFDKNESQMTKLTRSVQARRAEPRPQLPTQMAPAQLPLHELLRANPNQTRPEQVQVDAVSEQVMPKTQPAPIQQPYVQPAASVQNDHHVSGVDAAQVQMENRAPKAAENMVAASQGFASQMHEEHVPPSNTSATVQAEPAQRAANIPLAQRIRLQQHLRQQATEAQVAQQQPAAESAHVPTQTINRRPLIRSRETIDVLKLKERRVANG